MNKKKIIILGSGFGGIHAYLELHRQFHGKADALEVTMVSPTDYFLFTMLLHELATGGVHVSSLKQSVPDIVSCSCGLFKKFVKAEATAVDAVRRVVVTTAGDIPYDYLVVAMGAVTRMFDFDPSVVFTLKDLAAAEKLKSHIVDMFNRAASTADPQARKALLTFAVIGGGATGVELACDLSEFGREAFLKKYPALDSREFSIVLIQSGNELVPMFKPFLRRRAEARIKKIRNVRLVLNVRAKNISASEIILNTGEAIATSTAILVAGIQPRRLEFIPEAPLAKSGQVEVNEYLQIPVAPQVFVIGDMAIVKCCHGSVPQTAQAAKYEGWAAAKNIMALMQGKPLKAFEYNEIAQIVSLGRWRAAGEIVRLYAFGPVVWLLWRVVYVTNFLTWKNRALILKDWWRDVFQGKIIF